jgi:hypothetical protein
MPIPPPAGRRRAQARSGSVKRATVATMRADRDALALPVPGCTIDALSLNDR